MSLWQELKDAYNNITIEAPALKRITLAQWALESGWGQSKLAQEHFNFAGLKFREEMKSIAEPKDYAAHDGIDTYCAFKSIEDFIKGYWVFIDRAPYKGWREHAENPVRFLRHLAAAGYAGDPQYVKKVLNVYDKVGNDFTEDVEGETESPGGGGFRLAIVVGHNKKAKGAELKFVEPGRSEFEFNSEVADAMAREAGLYSINAKVFTRKAGLGSTKAEIANVYSRVDKWGADASIELHFNSFSSDSASGTETLSSGSKKSLLISGALQEEILAALDLDDRGVKVVPPGGRGYLSVTSGEAPAALVEPFFGSNRDDCVAAMALGEDGLARAYLRGCQAALAEIA